jgi:hypothetical protein
MTAGPVTDAGPDDEHADWYRQGWEAGYRKGLAAVPFVAQDVKRGSPFAEWAELVGRVATERDDALARLARYEAQPSQPEGEKER